MIRAISNKRHRVHKGEAEQSKKDKSKETKDEKKRQWERQERRIKTLLERRKIEGGVESKQQQHILKHVIAMPLPKFL